jgi:hypothetical protein
MMANALEKKSERVIQVATHAFFSAINYHACIGIFETGTNQDLWQAIDEEGAKKTFDIIRSAIFHRVILDVTREFSPVRANDYHLRVAIELLDNKEVFNAIAEKGEPQKLLEAIKQFDRLESDPRLRKMIHIRNKMTAHLSDLDPNIANPLNHEIISFADDTSQVAEALVHGTGIITLSLASQMVAHGRSAQFFWDKWLK